MTKRNEAIGEIECPNKGCTRTVPIFKYNARPTENMRRFAGKLYCVCPAHGRFGTGNGDTEMQDYLLNEGTIWGANDAGKKPAEPATPDSTKTPAIPRQLPAKVPVISDPLYKELPAQPAPKPPAKPATEPAAPAHKSWFGLD
jgi:hypothetical protein